MESKKINLKKKEKTLLKNKILTYTASVIIFIFSLYSLYYLLQYNFLGGRIKNYVEQKKPIAILLLGLDDSNGEKKTDTILIGIFNPASKRFGIIGVPRDLKVKVETPMGFKTTKINTIYSLNGPKKLLQTINKLTGLAIPFYASLDLSSLIKIIDLIGGIEVYIDQSMKYNDRSGNLYIDLPEGVIKCDGYKAMEYIRFRNDERGDIGRIDRQYEFLLNVVKNIFYKGNFLLNIKLIKIIYQHVNTNLNFNDILNLIKFTSSADYNNVEMTKIPGQFVNLYGIDYIEPDPKQIQKTLSDFMYKISIYKPDFMPEEIKVQVLNGSGKSGAAKITRDKLVRYGYNVVEFANAPHQNYENTLVLNTSGNMKKAIKVAQVLKNNQVYTKINKFILIDVTVIVGKDYQKISK